MRHRGGYILHIDGTCEEASRVLLVCLDSLSGQVLESRKISSENVEEVEQVLRDVRRDWGFPLAIVHDLRKSLITAAGKVFSGSASIRLSLPLRGGRGQRLSVLSCGPSPQAVSSHEGQAETRGAMADRSRSLLPRKDSGDHVLSSILEVRSIKHLRNLSTP